MRYVENNTKSFPIMESQYSRCPAVKHIQTRASPDYPYKDYSAVKKVQAVG
jgi:hypothetical protein